MRLKLMILTVLTLFISVLFAPLISHAAQRDMPQFCDNSNGAFYRPNVFPHYTGVNYRLSLDNWSTGEEMVLLAESLPYSFLFSWSPDCRYLIGYSDVKDNCAPGVLIWDTVSGEQKLTADGFCDRFPFYDRPHIFWLPNASEMLISEWYSVGDVQRSTGRAFIWHPAANQRVDFDERYSAANLYQIYWDGSRNWLWSSAAHGVVAFDRSTGAIVANFRNTWEGNYRNPTSSNFVLSPDNTKVIVYGQRTFDGYESAAMTVYDIASGVGTQVNVERNGAGVVALSPDNRYLVMGYTALRVWDLQNLPEDMEARLPINRVNTGGERISAMRFLDNATVEVVDSTETATWNILTGERISSN